MSQEEITISNRAGSPAETADASTGQRRQRLAQMIGHLLAQTWLQRRSETDTSATTSRDAPAENGASQAPTADQ